MKIVKTIDIEHPDVDAEKLEFVRFNGLIFVRRNSKDGTFKQIKPKLESIKECARANGWHESEIGKPYYDMICELIGYCKY